MIFSSHAYVCKLHPLKGSRLALRLRVRNRGCSKKNESSFSFLRVSQTRICANACFERLCDPVVICSCHPLGWLHAWPLWGLRCSRRFFPRWTRPQRHSSNGSRTRRLPAGLQPLRGSTWASLWVLGHLVRSWNEGTNELLVFPSFNITPKET